MGWQTFIEWCRSGTRDFYTLWQSQFGFDVADRVLHDESQHILVFDSESEEREYASQNAEALIPAAERY